MASLSQWRNLVLCVRWSFRGFRLRTTCFLAGTFLVILTTNLYLLNRNGNFEMIEGFRYSNDQKGVKMGNFAVDKTSSQTNDEYKKSLRNKMKQLKNELEKTRTRIAVQKQDLDKIPKHQRDLTMQKQSEHKLKRHLMNANSLEKSVVTLETSTIKQRLSKGGKKFTFLYQNIFSTQNSTFLSCQDLPQSTDALETVGSGYTKKVTKARFRGRLCCFETSES